MNIVMLVSEAPISIPLVTYLGVKLLSHVVNSILVFGGSPKLFSIAAVIFYIPINNVQRASISPYPHKHLLFLCFVIITIIIIIAILIGVKWY